MHASTKRAIGSVICVVCIAIVGAIGFGIIGPGSGGSAAGSGAAAGATDATATWTATQDDDLSILTTQVAGGNVVAMPGDGWAPRDGYVQLQLSGSSIGGQAIESVTQDGDALTVKLKSAGDGVATLDLVATEYRLAGGDVSSVKSVNVTYSDGQTAELEQAYE